MGDQRLMTPLPPEQRAWLVAYWDSYTQQHPGRVDAAVVHADDVFARLAVRQLRQAIGVATIACRSFADKTAAAAWLAQY